jgi:hypothetical protein
MLRVPGRTTGSVLVMALVGLLGCFSGCPKSARLQPIKVVVVDEATRRPLAGVPVAYIVHAEVSRPKLLGIVPPPEPTLTYRIVRKERAISNSSGEAVFEVQALRLAGDESVSTEEVFVNVAIQEHSPVARILRATSEELCRGGNRSCSDTPDDLDLIARLDLIPDERRDGLQPATPQWTGACVIFAKSFDGPMLADPSERVTLRGVVSERQTLETVVVGLRHLAR